MSKLSAPYGTWSSPITAEAITQKTTTIVHVFVDPVTSVPYHIEARPSEGGRCVVVRSDSGQEVFGRNWDARSSVQTYGGAAAVAYNNVIYFSHAADRRIYRVREECEPEPVTPENKIHHFADFAIYPGNEAIIVAVLEDRTYPAPLEIITSICLIDTQTKTVYPLLSGADFYAAPRFSLDGRHMAWQQWFLPDMPWEGSQVSVAKVSSPDEESNPLELVDIHHVAGKTGSNSALYPFWASSDFLVFTSDQSGYQNPWGYKVSSSVAKPILFDPVKEDFSEPTCRLGSSPGTALTENILLFGAIRHGRSVLYKIDVATGNKEDLECPYVTVQWVQRVSKDTFAFLGSKSTEAPEVVRYIVPIPGSQASISILRSTASDLDELYPPTLISVPEPKTIIRPPNDEPLHVVFYQPLNPEYTGSSIDGERPPCVVNAHGGPTNKETQALDWKKQYFTSRGWAWLDVNYTGSSGYGRKYIERLEGNWGITDVQDCVHAASHFASSLALIDPKRTVIRGASAGGFTTLTALCAFPDAFVAGTSLYGISDMRKLVEDTHKIELKRGEKLMGGTLEEIPEVYEERSPVFHAEKIKAPLLILQGSVDAVVPPSQAKLIVRSIEKHGGKVECVVLEGEGHGWRKAENMNIALEKELQFYCDVLGIALPR